MRILRVFSAVVVTLSLLVSTAVPANAHAVWAFQQSANGEVWGQWSVQFGGTYNGDGVISARVRDVFTDGSCVSAVYRDGGANFVQAVSCRHWANHRFFDQTGDSSARVRVNRTQIADPLLWVHISGY